MNHIKIPAKEKKSQKKTQKLDLSKAQFDFNTLKHYEKNNALEKFLIQYKGISQIEDKKILNFLFNEHTFEDQNLKYLLMYDKIQYLLTTNDVEKLDDFLSSYSIDSYKISEYFKAYDFSCSQRRECYKLLFQYIHINHEIIDFLFNNKCYELIEHLVDLGQCKRYELSHRLDEALKQLSDDNIDFCLFLLKNGGSLYLKRDLTKRFTNLSEENKEKLMKLCTVKDVLMKKMTPKPFQDSEFTVLGRPERYDHLLSSKICVKLLRNSFVCDYIYETQTKSDLNIEELIAIAQ